MRLSRSWLFALSLGLVALSYDTAQATVIIANFTFTVKAINLTGPFPVLTGILENNDTHTPPSTSVTLEATDYTFLGNPISTQEGKTDPTTGAVTFVFLTQDDISDVRVRPETS